jgi:hypothetical protein
MDSDGSFLGRNADYVDTDLDTARWFLSTTRSLQSSK